MLRGGPDMRGASVPGVSAQEGTREELGDRFRVRERMTAFADDYYVENAQGERVFWIDGKKMRIRATLLFKDMQGMERYRSQERLLFVRGSMTLEHPDGSTAAEIQRALITPQGDRYTIAVPGRESLVTKGDVLQHEYTIEQRGRPVGSISKRWFRMSDSYGVRVTPGTTDPLLTIAICVVIDQMQGLG